MILFYYFFFLFDLSQNSQETKIIWKKNVLGYAKGTPCTVVSGQLGCSWEPRRKTPSRGDVHITHLRKSHFLLKKQPHSLCWSLHTQPEALCALGRAPRALKGTLGSFEGQKVPMGGAKSWWG